MTGILIRYNKSRALGAIIFPIIGAGLMFGPDVAGGFVLDAPKQLLGDVMMIVGLVWWTYALIPDAVRMLSYPFGDVSAASGNVRLADGSEIAAGSIERVYVVPRFLRGPNVQIVADGKIHTIQTMFQAVSQRTSADDVSDKLLNMRRSALA